MHDCGGLGVLAAPLISLDTQNLPLIVVPALAAALLANFTSVIWACVAGLVIGMSENLLYYLSTLAWFPKVAGAPLPGVQDVLVFVVILITVWLRGGKLPRRGDFVERRLPVAPRPERLLRPAAFAVVLGVLALIVFPFDFRQALMTSMIGMILALSLVLVTGFVGQVTVMQLALSGAAGLVVSHLAGKLGIGFPFSLVAAAAAAVVVGLIAAIPALRVRGVMLAVVTLSATVALSNFGFANSDWGTGLSGAPVPQPTLLGLNLGNTAGFKGIDGLFPSPVLGFVILAFGVGLCMLVVNIRRGGLGRRMLAVRANERAAAAAGINVGRVKLIGFSIGAAIAGVAGALYGYNFSGVAADRFTAYTAITVIAFSYIGGMTMVSGALFAGFMAVEGLSQYALQQWLGIDGTWVILLAGIALIGNVVFAPAGGAGMMYEKKMYKRRMKALGTPVPNLAQKLWTRVNRTPQTRRLARGIDVRRLPRSVFRVDAFEAVPTVHGGAVSVPVTSRDGKVECRSGDSGIRRQSLPPVRAQTLAVRNLTVRFGGITAVSDVSMSIAPGEIVGLIGPNGAGKSTLIDALTGFARVAGGTIRLGDKELTDMAPHERVRAGLVRSWQTVDLFDDLSVYENMQATSRQTGWQSVVELVVPARRALSAPTEAAVRRFGLSDEIERLPTELSFSQRRVVSTARAVALNPSVLLLDEPAGGLSDVRRRALAEVIAPLARDLGMGLLIVDHDMPFVMDLADRVVVLNLGQKIADGTPAEVRANPAVVSAYVRGDAEERAEEEEEIIAAARTRHARVAALAHEPLLAARDMAVGYNENPVVRGIDLDVRPGEVVALLGANRVGKTTTLLGLAGVIQPLQGEVRWLGEKVTKRAPLDKRAAEGLGFLPAERAIFGGLTVAENLRVDRRCDAEHVVALFPELEPHLSRRAGLLSGGQQQMLGLGRALARHPKVLLIDEMSLGLAPILVTRLMEVVREAADHQGVGVVLVEQHVQAALRIADSVCIIADGRMTLAGNVEDVADRVEDAFLADVLGQAG